MNRRFGGTSVHLRTTRRYIPKDGNFRLLRDCPFLAYFSMLSVCLCLRIPLTHFWTLEPIFMKLCYVYHVIWANLNGVLHKSLSSISVSVCVSPRIVARQWLGRHVPVVTNTSKNGKLLGASFSVQYVSYQRIVSASVCESSYCCYSMAR
jgi:hypothetical protein